MNLITQNKMTMNSLEIADLVKSRHDNVRISIERLANKLVIQLPPMQLVEDKQSLSANNKTNTYIFSGEQGKRDSIVVVAQLSPEFTAILVDRWQELERGAPKLPNFNNPAESARAWAEQFEANQIAQQQLAEAQPKIDFVDRYASSNACFGFREVCKKLSANEMRFREFLISNHIMYILAGKMTAKQNHIDAGRFRVVTGVAENTHAYAQAKFTAKGVEWIAGEWAKYNLREQA